MADDPFPRDPRGLALHNFTNHPDALLLRMVRSLAPPHADLRGYRLFVYLNDDGKAGHAETDWALRDITVYLPNPDLYDDHHLIGRGDEARGYVVHIESSYLGSVAHLLAHELFHVLQRQRAAHLPWVLDRPRVRWLVERGADRYALRATGNSRLDPSTIDVE